MWANLLCLVTWMGELFPSKILRSQNLLCRGEPQGIIRFLSLKPLSMTNQAQPLWPFFTNASPRSRGKEREWTGWGRGPCFHGRENRKKQGGKELANHWLVGWGIFSSRVICQRGWWQSGTALHDCSCHPTTIRKPSTCGQLAASWLRCSQGGCFLLVSF